MYPAGIPLLFFLALFLNRDLLFEDPSLTEAKERLESDVFELHMNTLALQVVPIFGKSSTGNCAMQTMEAEVIREELFEKEQQLETIEDQIFIAEKMRGRLGFLYRHCHDGSPEVKSNLCVVAHTKPRRTGGRYIGPIRVNSGLGTDGRCIAPIRVRLGRGTG